MPLFFIILGTMLLLDILWLAVAHKLLANAPRWRWFVMGFIFLQAAAFSWFLIGRITGQRWDLTTPIMSSMYLWHLIFLPVLNLLGLVLILIVGIGKSFRKKQTPTALELESVQSRRQFLLTSLAVTPPLVNLALTGFSQHQIEQFRLREMDVPISNLPPALDGVTIVHVSDLHVGPFTSESVTARIAERINSLRADLVVFTGDLINSKLTELPQGIAFMRSLEAKSGVYLVEGNHDLFDGREAFENQIRASGINFLLNETATLRVRNQPLQLLGLRWGGGVGNPNATDEAGIRESLAELLTLREGKEVFPLLLAHHPHVFDAAAEAGLPLTLAGHTHGGQLMLSPELGFGPLIFRYWSGLYQKSNSRLVVSNGAGNWFPMRTAAPAEIALLKLRLS